MSKFCVFSSCNQDDDGDNAFHLAADAAKFIRECLECILLILKYPGAAIGVRNHRQVLCIYNYLIYYFLRNFLRAATFFF